MNQQARHDQLVKVIRICGIQTNTFVDSFPCPEVVGILMNEVKQTGSAGTEAVAGWRPGRAAPQRGPIVNKEAVSLDHGEQKEEEESSHIPDLISCSYS